MCDAPVRTPHIHTAPLLPGRDHSQSPSTPEHSAPPPLTMVAHVSDPDRRLTGLYETRFGSTSTCLSRARQRYHPRVSQQPSWCPGFESRVQNHVRPPHVTATLCPDRGAAEPSCTPLTCAACSPSTRTSHAAPTQPGRYQFPSPSTRVPIRRPVALTWPVHTFQVRAGDSRGARRPSLARSLRERRCRLDGALYELGCCRVSSRAAVCCGV